MKLKFIDLFCGAGGVTTGIERAKINNQKIANVIACVNHDPLAIASHLENHPGTFHFTEDIRTLDLNPLVKLIKRKLNQNDILCLWASIECQEYSRAKGGLPKNADSRTLANHLFRYIDELNPSYIMIENVEEFMSWGALDENGKPIYKLEGHDYVKWINNIKSRGYAYDWRILNSADFGAYTSRKRYFGVFAKTGLPIYFPAQTHSKDEKKTFFGEIKKWKPVKDVLDFNDSGESIFKRKKSLSENTLKRIYAGLTRYIGKTNFILKYNSKKNKTSEKEFNNTVSGIDYPLPTISTQVRMQLVRTEFLNKYHGNGNNILSIEQPCSTLSTKDRIAKVSIEHFIQKTYSGESNHQNINSPIGSILTVDKHALVSAFLMNPQFNSNGASLEKPCFTLIATMDKRPPYYINAEYGNECIDINNNDNATMQKIKIFMKENHIIDIKMRMLRIHELLEIQGFGKNYILKGNHLHFQLYHILKIIMFYIYRI